MRDRSSSSKVYQNSKSMKNDRKQETELLNKCLNIADCRLIINLKKKIDLSLEDSISVKKESLLVLPFIEKLEK